MLIKIKTVLCIINVQSITSKWYSSATGGTTKAIGSNETHASIQSQFFCCVHD